MEKIIYCQDSSVKKRKPLPFPCKVTANLRDATKTGYRLIIFEENFLKKRSKFDVSSLKDKVCLLYFLKENKDNLKLIKRFGFFDYFTVQDAKDVISFKLAKAREVLKLKSRAILLENAVKERDSKIEALILLDPISGCYNWRYFYQRVPQEINRSRRHLYSVCFFAVDIDNFRHINEIYGLEVGDFVIRELAELLKKMLRKEDTLVRWREDEFFIIAPHLPGKDTYKVACRISEKIVLHNFRYKKVGIHIKVSIGVVSSPEDCIFDARQISNALSICISTAKKKGGSTIVLYSQASLKSRTLSKGRSNVRELQAQIEKMNVLMDREVLEMIYGFARAIEAKDSYTGKHVEYTAELAEEIAKSLQLSQKNVEDIKHAAVLHDLGKVGIDGAILSKKGKLTHQEREVIKTHPAIAAEILREINGLRGSIPAILYHHERYDGGGYPLGLKGEEIPLSARIVAIADVYQALTSDRSYRKAYPKKKALEIIQSESGRQFDPKIVKAFLQVIKKLDAKQR